MKIIANLFLVFASLSLYSDNLSTPYLENLTHNSTLVFQDKTILKAINCLDEACLLTRSINDLEIQESVFNQLRSCITCLKQQYLSKDYESVNETFLTLYENLGEILADCQEEQVREEITHHVHNTLIIMQIDN